MRQYCDWYTGPSKGELLRLVPYYLDLAGRQPAVPNMVNRQCSDFYDRPME